MIKLQSNLLLMQMVYMCSFKPLTYYTAHFFGSQVYCKVASYRSHSVIVQSSSAIQYLASVVLTGVQIDTGLYITLTHLQSK